jgi:heat-inducible transcriptional repressor
MTVTDSEQRRKRILETIIEAYVSTASPVGSELIARRLRASLSPATIRHIMAELEKAGYLEQPHTSAGRVPTDRGYRFYVDSVMDVRRLAAEELERLAELLQAEAQVREVVQFLERVSEVLAELAQQAAFVVAPTVKRSTVRQIELVPLGMRKILCILVANEEIAASHLVEVEEPLSRDEAVALGRFINTELVGLPFGEVLGSLQRRLLAENDSFYHLVKRSLAILEHALAIEPTERLFLDGASYVVAQPEFQRDPNKAHGLLKAFEAQQALIGHLRDEVRAGAVQIRIGHELGLGGVEDCSCVSAPFVMGEGVTGGVGILGPRRMDYRRMSAVVDGVAHAMTELFSPEGP